MIEPTATIQESPPPDKQFHSLGYMAQHFQQPVQALRVILAAAGIKPSYLQNDIPFFDGYGLLAVAHALEGQSHE